MVLKDRKENQIISAIATLATLGIVVVMVLIVIILLIDRNKTNSNSQTDSDLQLEETTLDMGYGISFSNKLLNYKLENSDELGTIDCRKLSTQLAAQEVLGGKECFKVKVSLEFDQYVLISTGDLEVLDDNEKYIFATAKTGEIEKVYPEAKINLPVERLTISDFPTNLNGVQVIYPGTTYTAYKGMVYKGADKYGIYVSGDISSQVKELLSYLVLE